MIALKIIGIIFAVAVFSLPALFIIGACIRGREADRLSAEYARKQREERILYGDGSIQILGTIQVMGNSPIKSVLDEMLEAEKAFEALNRSKES
jgi:hypothetical protein